MSDYDLRARVAERIQGAIAEIAGHLVDRGADTLDQMRINQGRVAGLRLAQQILTDEYRKLHS